MFLKINAKDRNEIFINFIISRIFLLFVIYFMCQFNINTIFDCEHYMNIAFNGYTEDMQYAFFPLVPLLIRYCTPIGLIIINQIASLLSAYIFFYISENYLQLNNPQITAKLWLWSPIAIFTMIYYTESLFIFFTLFAFYLYKEKKYISSGIVLGLSVATRNTGSILFFSLFIALCVSLIKRKEKLLNIIKMYIPATIISCLYPLYLQIAVGNWKIFMDVQYTYWEKESSNLISLIPKINYIINTNRPSMKPFYYFDYFFALFLIILILVICLLRIKDKKFFEIIIYAILSIIIITSASKSLTCPTVSYYRYLFGCFSVTLLMPQKKYIVLLFKIFCIAISSLFLCGIWFY